MTGVCVSWVFCVVCCKEEARVPVHRGCYLMCISSTPWTGHHIPLVQGLRAGSIEDLVNAVRVKVKNLLFAPSFVLI